MQRYRTNNTAVNRHDDNLLAKIAPSKRILDGPAMPIAKRTALTTTTNIQNRLANETAKLSINPIKKSTSNDLVKPRVNTLITSRGLRSTVDAENKIPLANKEGKTSGLSRIPQLDKKISTITHHKSLTRLQPAVVKPVATSKNLTRSSSALTTINNGNEHAKSVVPCYSYSSNLLGQIPKNVEDIDAGDFPNVTLLPEFVNDVYTYLRYLECQNPLSPNFLSKQKELKPALRSVVVDWLISVHHRFRLLAETLYLGIAIMDRFFAREIISKDKIQLVGVTSFLIAAKFEEIFPPEVKDFVNICADQYKKSDVFRMEMGILKSLDFKIAHPSPMNFLRRLSKAGSATPAIHLMAKYLMELTLVEAECAHWQPSLLAAVAFYVSNRLLGDGIWDDTLVFYSGYEEKSLETHISTLCKIILRAPKSKYTTCRTKYGTPRHSNVSKSPELESAFVYERAGIPMPSVRIETLA